MQIACTLAPGRGDADLMLEGLAHQLLARGIRVCGTVQINSERRDAGPCDMDIRVLPAGPTLRISQDLGKASRGCRLDPAALETAVALVEAQLRDGADILLINKFGKHEAEGRGFRAAIGEAVANGIPVLVGLNALNAAAFHDFVGGLATEIAPIPDMLLAWALGASAASAEAA
jgi:nucleoside-triphosphatase THEP1